MKRKQTKPKHIAVLLSDDFSINYLWGLIQSGGYESWAEIVREALRWHSKIDIKMRATI